ncbi:hypothetical protein NL676_004090 [Syzygium grande]|nr:hypothetical protein NL676_004090 [Syzygium grande]
MVGPGRPQFVLFGSSIVQLSYSNGSWAAILSDVYARKDAAVQSSLIIVYFGGDDSLGPHSSGLGPQVPPHEYVENMRTIGEHLKQVVVEEIPKVLKEAEWKPSLHWKSMPTEFAEDSPYDLVAANGKTTLNPLEWTFHRVIQWD